MKKKYIVIALAWVIIALLLPFVVQAAPIGKITAIEGRVDLTPSGATQAKPVTLSGLVNQGDILRTKSKSKVEVTMTDGNIMRLAENTRLRLTKYDTNEGKESYFNLFRGKTQAVVDKLKKGSRFEMHTPTAICGVRGTVFFSFYQNNQSGFVFQAGSGYGYPLDRPQDIKTITPKILMLVLKADKPPIMKPATEAEVEKHIKDTSFADKPKDKEEKKEEKKTGGSAGGEGQQEGVKKEEAKKEDKKGEDQKQGQQQDQGQQTDQSSGPPPTSDPTQDTIVQAEQQQQQQTINPTPPAPAPPTPPTPVQDTTPPTINFTSGPTSTTNADSATLTYNANEKSDFQYSVDGGTWQTGPQSADSGSNSITDLSEGSHTFDVKATDAAGNSSTKTYSWATNYESGPPVTISPQAAVPADNGKTDVDVNLSSTDTTYKYKVDNGTYQTTEPSFTVSGLGSGDHALYAFGRNDDGLRGREASQSFTIRRYNDFPGKIWLTGNITSEDVLGKIAAVANDTWGTWIIDYQGTGTLPSSWTSYAGKANSANDDGAYFWLNQASGTATGGNISGSSTSMRYMTWNTLGQGNNGTISGNQVDGGWSMTDTGKGKYSEKDLKFASLVGAWSSSGQQEAQSLVYGKNRDLNFQHVTSSTAPVQMELSWSTSDDLDSHAWVPASPGRSYTSHIFYRAKGSTGYNKFRYPAAYLDNDSTSGGAEKTLFAKLYRGDTYFSVYNYSQEYPTNATLKVYERLFKDYGTLDENAGTLLDTRTGVVNVWRHLYKLTAPADPAGNFELYYADYEGNAYPLDNEYVSDSTIQGMLAGTQSIVTGTATDIPISLIGQYTLNDATKSYNRSWHLDLVPYDTASTSATRYLTKDAGAYLGFLGGIIRPENERIEGLLSAIYLDSSGNAGLLKGSFGAGNDQGALYPGISMWEADGTVNRYDLSKNSGINPTNLSGQWYYVSPVSNDPKDSWTNSNDNVVRTHYSSWDWDSEIHRSYGIFYEGTSQIDNKIPMSAREDYIDSYRIKMDNSPTSNDTFGVWNWEAYGGYGETKNNWIMAAHSRLIESDWSSTKTKSAVSLFARGSTAWTDGRFTGLVSGFGGDGEVGRTYVYGGDMLGTYNSGLSFFNANAVGSFMETDKYLAMMDSDKSTLIGLGYQTEELKLATDQQLDGTLSADAGKAAKISGLRVFSFGSDDPLRQGVSNNLSASTAWSKQAIYPITGNDDRQPVYGVLRYLYDASSGGYGGYWLGEASVLGAFKLADGSVKQIAWGDYAAGSYNSYPANFSGTVGGAWVSSPFLSEITRYPYTNPSEPDPDSNKRAYLWYYAGEGITTEGYLKGLMGSSDPTLWPETAAFSGYPYRFQADIYGVWIPPQGSSYITDYRGHIFGTTIYPKNFELSTAQNPVYTTTTGHSYWGYLRGIHQYYNSNNNDGMKSIFSGVFIDKNNNAGIVNASMGQANWGFDRDKNAYVMYNNDGVLVALDTVSGSGTTAANLVSSMDPETSGNMNHQDFALTGGVIKADDPQIMGQFYSGTTAQGEYINIPGSFTLGTNWISDVNRRWGVWHSDMYGTYTNYAGDHWFGELQNTQDSPQKPAGLLILGENWMEQNTAKREFQGTVAGYWADITKDEALTGILSGELLGTYSTDGGSYYGTVAAGSFFETNQYLDMANTSSGRIMLANLNIPAVQVGSVNLSGSNTNYGLNVDMNGVKFFAYNTGAMPMLWATNSVSGSYSQAQQAGNWVDLTSTEVSLQTRFKLLSWYENQQNRWTAEVKGSGDIGNTVNLQELNIRGAAAGTISGSADSGSFDGTAAGVVNKDFTPPVVSIDSGPKEKTNAHDATFNYSANRPIQTWSYQVDSGGWINTTDSSVALTGLAQATHGFQLKGTDNNGNISEIKSWSWETNYEKPTLTATPKSASPDGDTTGTVSIDLAGSKPGTAGYTGTYEYKIDSGTYQPGEANLQANVAAGSRTITTRTTDEYGNISDPVTTSFTLTRNNAGGKMWATGMENPTTDVLAKFAGVTNESWGGWKVTANGDGTPASSWQAYAGGENDTTRTYWLSRSSGTAADNSISGSSSEMTFLRLSKTDSVVDWTNSLLGYNNEGKSGTVTGTYNSSTWNITDTGAGIYTEKGLKYYGELLASTTPDYFRQWNVNTQQMDKDPNSSLTGLLGSTQSLWASPDFKGLGGATNSNDWKIWTVGVAGDSDDGSRFKGSIGGILKPLIADENRYPTEGFGQAFYIRTVGGVNKAGYFKFEDISGFSYPDIAMWQNTGRLEGPGDKGDTSYTPAQLDANLLSTDPLKRTINYDVATDFTGRLWTRSIYLADQTTWRLTKGEMGGRYNGQPAMANTGGLDLNPQGGEVNYSIGTMSFNDWSDDRIQGTTSSRQLGWMYKGTTSGDFLGNLIPDSPGATTGTWQALSRGVQDREPLAFASLVGSWGTDGSRNRAALSYFRRPVYEKVLVADNISAPLRIDTYEQGYGAINPHAWIPPSQRGSRYFHLFENQQGVQGYNKYRYPSAYLGDDNKARFALFQSGNTYFSVNRPGAAVAVYVYNSAGELIDEAQGTIPSGQPWWNLYVLETGADPSLPSKLYRYGTVDEFGVFSTLPALAYERVNDDGGILGILGGTQSLIKGDVTKDIPVRLMGSYTGATDYNRFWGQQLIAYNADNGKYITYDDRENQYATAGTFFGNLGGILRPEAQRVEGIFHTFSIKPTGEAGILRGSFGTGEEEDTKGVIYPNLVVQDADQPEKRLWEANGYVSRYDMNVPTGITPSSLAGRWFQITDEPGANSLPYWEGENDYLGRIHASSWDDRLQMYRSNGGLFLDDTYTAKVYMTDRQDYLDIYKLTGDANNTFGIWSWRALGAYSGHNYAKWIIDGEFRDNSEGNGKFNTQIFGYGNAWTNGKFTGRNMGYIGEGDQGFTGILAGDMVGAYNDGGTTGYDYNSFGAVATGSWLNTEKYLDMYGTDENNQRQTLADLGYATDELPLTTNAKNLSGGRASVAGKAVAINPFRVFSPADNNVLKTFVSANLSAQTAFSVDGLYPVTSAADAPPVYGILEGQYQNENNGKWLGNLRGLGVFTQTDGSKIQASFSGAAAGSYGGMNEMANFSGTTAGLFIQTPFLSELSVAGEGKTAYLKYYDGTNGLVEEGYLQGLLGAMDPVSWTQTSIYPTTLDLQLVGVWQATNPARRGHIFNVEMYPYNFTNDTYTTTGGASFWGYLTGIHQVTGGSQDGIESVLSTFFVDKDQKAGFFFGKIGGPAAWQNPYGWGFDYNSQTFSADTNEIKAGLVEIGSTQTVTATNLKNSILSDSFDYRGGVLESDTSVIGKFYTTQQGQGGKPYEVEQGKINMAAVGTVMSNFINDGNVNGKWGVWSTDLYGQGYGGYSPGSPLPGHDHWIGELQTPETETPTKLMGSTIYGEPWQNNRIEGSVLGYWANIENAVTGISFGKLLGTFEPSSNTIYQATVSGGFLETNQFLDMAVNDATGKGRETLRNINVPCVQVGIANLTGSNENLTVNMNEARFFAFSSGAAPNLWATNNIAGQSHITNPTGSSVGISGDGLSATFTMNNWNAGAGKWLGAVTNGQGSIINGGSNVQNLQFRGAAAGPIGTAGAFSGTGAGVVRQVNPPPAP